MKELQLNIVSPEKELFNGTAGKVTLPGVMGAFTILPQHAPIVAALAAGTLSYTPAGEEEQKLEIHGGFVEMSGNRVSVCVD